MKRIFKILLIIFAVIVLSACNEETNIDDNTEHMHMDEEVSNKESFANSINSFKSNLDSNYSLVIFSAVYDDTYSESYALFNEKNVTEINYPNYNAIATFTIYYQNKTKDAKVVDLLYTFPVSYDETEKNLEIEYSLYNTLLLSLFPKMSEESKNKMLSYFEMGSFDEFVKIYNDEKEYNYKIIDFGNSGLNYLSTIFLSDSKIITLEYHDSSFEEEFIK